MRDWHFILKTDKSVTARCINKIPVHFLTVKLIYDLDWHLDDSCQQTPTIAVPKQ